MVVAYLMGGCADASRVAEETAARIASPTKPTRFRVKRFMEDLHRCGPTETGPTSLNRKNWQKRAALGPFCRNWQHLRQRAYIKTGRRGANRLSKAEKRAAPTIDQTTGN